MPNTTPSTPQELAFFKMFGIFICLAVLFLAPLGTMFLSFKLAFAFFVAKEAIAFTCIGGFLLGLAFPVIAIDYLARGRESALSKLYQRCLASELQQIKEHETSSVKQLRDAYRQLQAEKEALELELLEKEQEFPLGKWKN